jgi:putative SOS response-associated peptidase YedK
MKGEVGGGEAGEGDVFDGDGIGAVENDVVKPAHAKAMPAILTTPEECDAWLSVEPAEALKLQRPLAGGQLAIVARGEREDAAPESLLLA